MAQTILVVDGEEVVRDIVTSMLRSGGYEYREAQNGLSALTLLESGDTVDLILSELMMLELDGIGLLERVKEKYPSVPFAIMTAVHDESVAEAAISRGACDYLLKPFEREQLFAVVRRALATRTQTAVDRDQLMARTRQEIEEARRRWEEAKTRQLQPPPPPPPPPTEVPQDYAETYDEFEDGYGLDEESERRMDDIEQRLDGLESSGSSDSSGLVAGYSMGTTLAMILSWSVNRSVLWCICHGLASWFYVIYWVIVHRF